jgi:hypothetical protein
MLSRLTRPFHVRLCAQLIEGHRAAGVQVDLLHPDPPHMETWLRKDRWLLLGWPNDERTFGGRAVIQFATHILRRGASGFGAYNLAARPILTDADPRTWCPIPLAAGDTNWLLLRNGEVISHQVGGERVPDLRAAFWEPVGGPSWFFR